MRTQNLKKNWLASVAIFASVLLAAGNSQATWTYPRASVLEFLTQWKSQIQTDRYIEERERDLRIDLVDRLNFQVDRKYNPQDTDQDFKTFLIQASQDLHQTETRSSNQVYGNLSDFFKNLTESLQEVLEPAENILAFLRSFVEFSSLKTPQSVSAFAETRSYSNGFENEAAAEVSLEQAAAEAQQEFPDIFSPPQAPQVDVQANVQASSQVSELEAALFSDSETQASPPETTPGQSQNL